MTLASADISVSWSGGDGDFKLISGLSETFDLDAITNPINGSLIAVGVEVTEAFVAAGIANIEAILGFAPGPHGLFKYEIGDSYYSVGGLKNPLHIILNPTWDGYVGRVPSYIALMSNTGPVELEVTAGPADLSTLTAGKMVFTLHYIEP